MSWQIRVSSSAEKYYHKLSKENRSRFKKELEALAEQEDPGAHAQVKLLTGDFKGFYRLRIGSYRVIFSLLRSERIMAVVAIAPRGGAYKRK